MEEIEEAKRLEMGEQRSSLEVKEEDDIKEETIDIEPTAILAVEEDVPAASSDIGLDPEATGSGNDLLLNDFTEYVIDEVKLLHRTDDQDNSK